MTSRRRNEQGRRALRHTILVLAGLAISVISLASFTAHALTRIQLAPTGLGGPDDEMGRSVALVGDTAIVGAPNTQLGPGFNAGVVDVYREHNGVWLGEAILVASDMSPNMRFGAAVAGSQDLVVVGGGDGIYTFERAGDAWSQVDKLTGPWRDIGLSGDTLTTTGYVHVRSGTGWELQTQVTGDDFGEVIENSAIDGDFLAVTSYTRPTFAVTARHVYFYSRSGTEWTREARIALAGGDVYGFTPSHVALSGQTAMVALTGDDFISRVHVFSRDGMGAWSAQGDLDAGTDLRYEIGLDIEGDRALVTGGSGTFYTFLHSGGAWVRELHFGDPSIPFGTVCFVSASLSGSNALGGCPSQIMPSGAFGKADVFSLDSDPPAITAQFDQGDARQGEQFGSGVALSGSTMVVRTPSDAYVFERTGGEWAQQAQILSSKQLRGNPALDGDTAALGFRFPEAGAGSVQILTRANNVWTEQQTLSGFAPENTDFGLAVALQGNTLAVGEPQTGGTTTPESGSCHVFDRAGATWSENAELQPGEGESGDQFCSSVSLSNDTLLIGAPGSNVDVIEYDAGAAYVFVRSQGTWLQQARLVAPVPAVGATLGRSVAIKGDTAVVGAGWYGGDRGAAYVYKRNGDVWSWQATLTPPLPSPFPQSFGTSVAVSDTEDKVLVSMPSGLTDDGYVGLVFAFELDAGQWSYVSTLQATLGYPYDQFGSSMSMSGQEFAIGAPGDGSGGAVYQGSLSNSIFSSGFESSP